MTSVINPNIETNNFEVDNLIDTQQERVENISLEYKYDSDKNGLKEEHVNHVEKREIIIKDFPDENINNNNLGINHRDNDDRVNDKGDLKVEDVKVVEIINNEVTFGDNHNGDYLKGETINVADNLKYLDKVDTIKESSTLSSEQNIGKSDNLVQGTQNPQVNTRDRQGSLTSIFSFSSSDDKMDFESRTSKSSFSSISINQQTDISTDNDVDSFVHIGTYAIKQMPDASLAENPELNDESLDDENYIQESPKEWGSQEWNSLKNFSSLFSSISSTSSVLTPSTTSSRRLSSASNYDLLYAKLEREDQILQEDPKARRISIQGIAEIKRSFEKAHNEANVNVLDDDIDWEFWGQIISDYENVARTQSRQLSKSIQKGIPQALRGMIWQLMSKSKDVELESKYAQLLKESSPHEKMIVRDLNRTFPKHEFFQDQNGVGQEGLFHVVKAYSIYDPEMPDEEAFCILVKLMKHYNMRGHFLPGMDGLQLRLFQFDHLVEEMLPKIHSHLLAQGINSSMYASQWFMTLFAYKFPLSLVFRIYDTIFTEGIEAIFRFSIALLKKNEKRIVELDFEPLLEFLKSGLFESYQVTPTDVLITEAQYRTNEFVKDAYDIRITVKTLNKHQQAYYAHQENEKRRLIAEAGTAERMRANNIHLSNKIKSLESSLQTLDREHVELANNFISTKMELAQCKDENEDLSQMVINLRRGLETQSKEIESKLQGQMDDLIKSNIDLIEKNNLLEDQLENLENMLIEIKVRYAESENERETLKQKWSDLKRALG
ncbi:12702_t:CDS:2 [Entrophospora sp. SA101]|nr:5661_t:CDS:2 [Entrophospora sp. SA101]CAJ0649749.1 5665_t:CDS:2 [Entrophospora sp. SA101]CAJ0752595.1 12702_t:CDS:2 [Entrophospora sp. SA101]CAJ0902694.1 11551_t:CDS:2 [Entrophospora sp. SA101]